MALCTECIVGRSVHGQDVDSDPSLLDAEEPSRAVTAPAVQQQQRPIHTDAES